MTTPQAVDYGWIPVLGVVLMTVATIGLGLWATRRARTASDFLGLRGRTRRVSNESSSSR